MIKVKVDGVDRLTRMMDTISTSLSAEALTDRALSLARESGRVLHRGAMRACLEAIYQNKYTPEVLHVSPNGGLVALHGGNEPDRTEDLLNSHILVDEGLVQQVVIDPEMPVSENAHDGRELVIDYASYVHDGYTQWVHQYAGGSVAGGVGYSHNTGVFHPGRFWFDVVVIEMFPFILQAIEDAFTETVEAALDRMVA